MRTRIAEDAPPEIMTISGNDSENNDGKLVVISWGVWVEMECADGALDNSLFSVCDVGINF